MRIHRLVPALWLLGCQPVPVVNPNPVPPPDKLRPEDCKAAAEEYRKRLAQLSPGGDAEAPEPARLYSEFRADCDRRLAGRARRVVMRCWRDAPTAAAFLACNDRF